jgi:hypothetical protein
MVDVPSVPGEVVAVSPWHFYRLRRKILGLKMPFSDPKAALFQFILF